MIRVQRNFEMDPREGTGIEIGLEALQLTLISLCQQRADALAKGSIVGFAWHEHERGDEPVKLVPAQEGAGARAADEMQRAHDHRTQHG